jgi:hypothetical protein
MGLKELEYKRVENLISNSKVFYGDKGNGVFKKKNYPFILENNLNNLYEPIRVNVLEYFKQNNVAWWGGKLTNHPLSSQVACLNHLFPIRNDKDAVLSIIQQVLPEIIDVLPITTDKHLPAYIQFESVSDVDHLNEKNTTRGANCTSLDALILGKHKNGKTILFPIEWKYVEAYGNEDKGTNETRRSRYDNLINLSKQLITTESNKVYYYEPFYQLMRQTLWAEQMVKNKEIETIKADDYIHLHIIPTNNKDLLQKKYFNSAKGMEGTWRECIKDQSKYRIIEPKQLLSEIDYTKYRESLDYLRDRYWI